MDLINRLSANIFNNFGLLQKDFIGFKPDFNVVIVFLICLIISALMILTSFALGKKIVKHLIKKEEKKEYDYLIYTAVGFISISTFIGILGIFNLLKPIIISLLLVIIFILSFGFPFKIKENFLELYNSVFKTASGFKTNKYILIWIILFIFIALINLINPEIREDQYHIDQARIYLKQQTIIIPPKEGLQIGASPMLSEMYYMVGIFLYSKEVPRYLNFMFYLLTILALIHFSKLKNHKFAFFAPLLFASAPVVIKETSAGYTDFAWIFCLLLSTLLFIDSKSVYKKYILSGLFLGAMVAGKLWTIVISPVFTFFVIYKTIKEKLKMKPLIFFAGAFIAVIALWFYRAFILTGNPLFPAFGYSFTAKRNFFEYIGLNYALFDPRYYFNVFNPLFFVGIVFLLIKLKENIKLFFKLEVFQIFILILILYTTIHYPYGRYLLGLYIFFIFSSSLGLTNFIDKFRYAKSVINVIVFFVFIYYFISSALILPYSFGIANKNNYLSRIFVRDNSSYYDFGNMFDKHISKDDYVAMYNFHGYYYADFNYIDTNFIFDKNNRSFDLLKKRGITKLLIRSGDINWFCKNLDLSGCTENKYQLISDYSTFPNYYLYSIK